jgi:hypothetical protein
MAIYLEAFLDITDIPVECIKECSAPGNVDEAVEFWCDKLKFTVDRLATIKCLKKYGAWDVNELNAMSDAMLAERVLWLACCDFNEFIKEAEHMGVDPFNPPATFQPNSGSNMFYLG